MQVEIDQGLEDTIKQLQKQLEQLPNSDEQFEGLDDIENTIKQLEQQLEEPDQLSVQGLPPIHLITTILAMDEIIDQSILEKKKKYYQTLLEKKRKLIEIVKQGKLTSEKYIELLQNKDPENIINQMLKINVKKQKLLLTKFPTQFAFFQKIFQKFQASLKQQLSAFTVKKPEKIQSKPVEQKKVIPPPPVKKISPEQEKQKVINGLNSLSIDKKLQSILKSCFKLQSQLDYSIQHFSDPKYKVRAKELLQKMKQCKQIINELNKNENVFIGDFIINKIPKMTFQNFHQTSKKQYLIAIEEIIKKIKLSQKAQQNFIKRCSDNAPDVEEQSPSNYSITLQDNYEEYINYLTQLKTKTFSPLPTIKIVEKQRSTFVENPNLQKNQLHIRILHIQGIQGGTSLKLYIPGQQKEHLSEKIVDNGQQHTLIPIKLKDELLVDLTRLQISLKFSVKKMLLFNKDFGEVKLNPKDLQYKNYIEQEIQQNNLKVKYSISSKFPRSKGFKNKIQQITLVKLPQFKCDKRQQTEYIRKYVRNYIPQKQPRTPTLFFTVRTPEIISKLQSIKIQGLPQNQIIQPEQYCSSMQYCVQMQKVLDDFIKKIQNPKNTRVLAQNIQDTLQKCKNKISRLFTYKKITKEQYLQKLKGNIDDDLKLKQAYQKNGLIDFVSFIEKRSNLLIDEIQQLKFQLRVQKQIQQQKSKQQLQRRKIEEDKKNQQQSKKQQQTNDLKNKEQTQQSSKNEQVKQVQGLQKQEQQQSQQPKSELFVLQEDCKLNQADQDIKKPWLPQYCQCVSYIQQMITIVIDEQLKQKFTKALNDIVLELQSGTLEHSSYAQNLRATLQKDRTRLQKYIIEDIKDYAKFISIRIKIMQGQLENF